MPDQYTHGHEQSVLASHGTRTAANSAAYLLPFLEPGMSVLDVGCGPGSITLDLAQRVGQVIGIEPVEPPLIAAREAAAQRGDTATRFETGDVYALPFEDDRFDVVHAHQVLQHLTDPVGALREMARVCRPGGLVAARDADYAAFAWHPAMPELDLWRDVYRRIARGNGAEPDAARHLRAWAGSAGLADVTITSSTWTYASADSCAWWGGSWADRAAGDVFHEQAAAIGVTAEAVAAISAGWRRWAERPDAWLLIPHGELLARV